MLPLDICQAHLDEVDSAMLAGDFHRYKRSIFLPIHLLSPNGTRQVTTEAELRRDFDAYCETLRLRHVTELIRLAESAVPLQETMISCYYETNILANGLRLVVPYQSHMILRQAGPFWQTVSIANSFFLHLLSGAPGPANPV